MKKRVEDPVFQNPPPGQWAVLNGKKVPFDADEVAALQLGGQAHERLDSQAMQASGDPRDYLSLGGIQYPQGKEFRSRRTTIIGSRHAALAAEEVLSWGNTLKPGVEVDLTTIKEVPAAFKNHGV